MHTVTVYMSTFNGERYVQEQIESILNQRDVQIELWVRDDGSTDKTKEIIQDYAVKNKNIHLMDGEPCGVGRSFMQLLYDASTSSEYYAFSDQDDVWDDDKLISAVEMLREKSGKPALYVCNQRCVDANRNFISNRFPADFPKQELINELFVNLYAGCTMVFNHELKTMLCDKARRPELEFFRHRIHDAWVACVASSMDALIYDPSCHMEFRRHGENVTSAEVNRNKKVSAIKKIGIVREKVERRIKKRGNLWNGTSLTAENLLRGYSDCISGRDKELLTLVAEYRKSPSKKVKLLFGKTVKMAAPEATGNFFIKIMLNLL